MKHYIALCTAIAVMLAANSPARADDPLGLWRSIPPLPDVAEAARCDDTESVIRDIENAAAQSLTDAQLALTKMAPAAVTDDQGAAFEQLMDYSLQECAINAESEVWQLVQSARDRLSGAMNDLESRRIEALAECGSEMSPDYAACYSRTRAEFQARARETANRHLDEIAILHAGWRERAFDCLERRENAVARFDEAGVAGPFAAQALNVRTQTWMLVGLHAQTAKELCDAAYEASHLMDVE